MTITDRQLLNSLSRMPFIDSAGLAGILGEPHTTVHRALAGLLGDGMVGRVNHGTAYLPSSQRYYLTAKGVSEAAEFLGFDTPSDFVRSYPVSSEWLTLLIRRMDVVASVYRLAASMSPGTDGRSSHVRKLTHRIHSGPPFCTVDRTEPLRATFSATPPGKRLSSGMGTV